MIKKAARWVASGFQWLGRKMGLIPADRPPVISSAAPEPLLQPGTGYAALHSDIENIPGIQDIILGYTDDDLNDSAGYTGSPIPLFGHRLSVHVLLQHIVKGEQKAAEKMIEANLDLLLKEGTTTDDAKRTFKGITAFQAALWAKDRHMWTMILKYLPLKEAEKQLRAHENKEKPPEYVKKHGRYYDFSPLIQRIEEYVNYLNAGPIDWTKADRMWQQGVGGLQCQLPAHVVNEYCREDRPFYPLPTFKENHLPRTRNFFDCIESKVYSWFSPKGNHRLGVHYAIYRGDGVITMPMLLYRGSLGAGRKQVSVDLAAISLLDEVRTKELDELKRQLLAEVYKEDDRQLPAHHLHKV